MAGLVPAIHALPVARKTWMPGTRPGMTEEPIQRNRKNALRARAADANGCTEHRSARRGIDVEPGANWMQPLAHAGKSDAVRLGLSPDRGRNAAGCRHSASRVLDRQHDIPAVRRGSPRKPNSRHGAAGMARYVRQRLLHHAKEY